MKQSLYASTEQLNQQFSQRIVALLEEGIASKGRASLLVSGGRTPLGLFAALSTSELDWSKVDISLADERWVDASDDASNEKMVTENLLQNNAAKANFVSLKTNQTDAADAVREISSRLDSMSKPFDVLILGMGEDGHTASLFPCSAQIAEGLDMDSNQQVIAVTPGTAPHQRMSLTLPALLTSQNIFLHLTGDSKMQVLQQALDGDDELAMPIRAVLNRADVELIWAA
ncbi:6-phosphogluconolactonase [Neptunicella sp. SCSIO 80796]|uniref:6-phosphogluconolactonase n=1 Tax=Neptunicella plasticusilytica TaxID=3117012 RepID=UPI003A4DB7E8